MDDDRFSLKLSTQCERFAQEGQVRARGPARLQKAAETALGFRVVRITSRWSTTSTPEPTPRLTKGLIGDCACARGSSAEAVWVMRSDQKSSLAGGSCCCEANCLDHPSLVSGSEPYRRVRCTTGSTVTCKGRGSSAWLSHSQALSQGNSAQHPRRSHGCNTVDCAVDCSVGVGAYRPDAKGVQSVQCDRHRAGDAIAAAPSIDWTKYYTSAADLLTLCHLGECSEHSVLRVRSRLRTYRVSSEHFNAYGCQCFISRRAKFSCWLHRVGPWQETGQLTDLVSAHCKPNPTLVFGALRFEAKWVHAG
jgi:hypothetical protein